uniref:Uncharacterized protein n=1 Tax=viral metagenome TaxID=1070528 RepID=A0A6C0IGR2_9ZZZZ
MFQFITSDTNIAYKLNIIEYLPYILLIIIIIVLFIYGYIRIKYGFWAIQPVFHVYNIGYMIFPPGIIDHNLPDVNKYTNFKDIDTIVFDKMTKIKTTKFIHFIKTNYLQNKDNTFSPKSANIVPYFKGHSALSFVSFYTEDSVLFDTTDKNSIPDIIPNKKIIGLMTSRPLHIVINGKTGANFDAYYVDYLCVDTNYRKKGIAPQIIQTHHYNQRYNNKNIIVSLFKREDELTGIVPLCVYSTYGFPVTKWTKPNDLLGNLSLLEISPQNFHLLLDFIKNTRSKFDIFINTDISNIIELIKSKNIFIYVILLEHQIVCAYFYRKSCVFVEKNMEVLSCFASINETSELNDVFIHGFKLSFWIIADKNYFGFCAIENISDNNIIIDNLILKTRPSIISPTAYFFYNFAYPTFKAEKVFILN